MVMLLVVPGEELPAEATGLFERAKAVREVRPVFQRFEVGFRVGVIVRDMRTTMCLDDTKVCSQQGHGLGGHRGAPVRVDGQLARCNLLLLAAVFDELFRQVGRLTIGNHPARDIAAEDIQDDV